MSKPYSYKFHLKMKLIVFSRIIRTAYTFNFFFFDSHDNYQNEQIVYYYSRD